MVGSTFKGSESSLMLDPLPVAAWHKAFKSSRKDRLHIITTDWGHSRDQKLGAGRKAIMVGRSHVLSRTIEDPPLMPHSPDPFPGAPESPVQFPTLVILL